MLVESRGFNAYLSWSELLVGTHWLTWDWPMDERIQAIANTLWDLLICLCSSVSVVLSHLSLSAYFYLIICVCVSLSSSLPPLLSLSPSLSSAHGIRADGDAKAADVGAAGDGGGGRCTGPAGPAGSGEPSLQCLLLLLVLLL